jgi:hypothetical protein
MVKDWTIALVTLALVTVWSMPPALAQRGTAELRLTVKDGAGAAVAAVVDLVNDATKTQQTVELAADGRYAFKNLPFGWYRILVTHAGFTPSDERMEMRSEVPQSHEIVLRIQPVETAIQVTEQNTLVDPSRTGTAYYVGAKEVKERPMGLPGRDLIDLVAQQPGWFLEANGSLHPRESEIRRSTSSMAFRFWTTGLRRSLRAWRRTTCSR